MSYIQDNKLLNLCNEKDHYDVISYIVSIFTTSEIDTIVQGLSSINILTIRDIQYKSFNIYSIRFINGKKLEINDILDLNKFNLSFRRIELIITNNTDEKIIYFKYCSRIYDMLNCLMCKSYNMSRYQDIYSIPGYNSNNIIENYAKELALLLKDDYESLNDIRFTTYEIINNKATYNFSKNFYKLYKFKKHLEMEIIIKSNHIIKIQITDTDNCTNLIMYTSRDIIGLNNIIHATEITYKKMQREYPTPLY